jgi:5-oxoprolinase (ATP-hydrolysing)
MHKGGAGVVREMEFLQPMKVSLVTQRRGAFPPYGAHGGEHGAIGKNILVAADGTEQLLDGVTSFEVASGETIRIETPGGGGWGQTP